MIPDVWGYPEYSGMLWDIPIILLILSEVVTLLACSGKQGYMVQLFVMYDIGSQAIADNVRISGCVWLSVRAKLLFHTQLLCVHISSW
jgi:hypothetical protein